MHMGGGRMSGLLVCMSMFYRPLAHGRREDEWVADLLFGWTIQNHYSLFLLIVFTTIECLIACTSSTILLSLHACKWARWCQKKTTIFSKTTRKDKTAQRRKTSSFWPGFGAEFSSSKT
uniref:Uncharacterized protein n=1 Tax=Opuntia streptacantha TaxID=393608 RepID=A0A7C9AEM8_OPUST